MPLNVRRFCTFVFLVFSFSIVAFAQTSADVMRERVAKAKAYIAVKNYNAAIYELENIRRETKEPAVNSVVNVLLMNSYLEQSDYKRAQDFLKELQNDKSSSSAATNYFAAAGQVVKEARSQLERYKALGLSVSDRNLPLEAINDVEKMRETLEMVVEQSKVIGKDKAKTSEAMALLEEATNARGGLARDDFDANRWKNEISDAREQLANSSSVVVNAVDGTTTSAMSNNVAAQNTITNNQQISTLNAAAVPAKQPIAANIISPVSSPSAVDNSKTTAINSGNSAVKDNSKPLTSEPVAKNDHSTSALAEKPKVETKNSEEAAKNTSNTTSAPSVNKPAEEQKSENKTNSNQTAAATPNVNNNVEQKSHAPMDVGSLIEYVTQKVDPVYPPAARTVRMSGVVKVDVVVDEQGKVTEVQKTSGPQMLQRAATDAVKRWKFKPFVRDGQPTKATGYVSFNFSL